MVVAPLSSRENAEPVRRPVGSSSTPGATPNPAPWVVCEIVDDETTRDDCAGAWTNTVVLPREEALADPGVRETVGAWDRGDDSAGRGAPETLGAAVRRSSIRSRTPPGLRGPSPAS